MGLSWSDGDGESLACFVCSLFLFRIILRKSWWWPRGPGFKYAPVQKVIRCFVAHIWLRGFLIASFLLFLRLFFRVCLGQRRGYLYAVLATNL